eukprot:SAG11_NODE_141_length_14934_cov_4.821503_18_plen_119_part_00
MTTAQSRPFFQAWLHSGQGVQRWIRLLQSTSHTDGRRWGVLSHVSFVACCVRANNTTLRLCLGHAVGTGAFLRFVRATLLVLGAVTFPQLARERRSHGGGAPTTSYRRRDAKGVCAHL